MLNVSLHMMHSTVSLRMSMYFQGYGKVSGLCGIFGLTCNMRASMYIVDLPSLCIHNANIVENSGIACNTVIKLLQVSIGTRVFNPKAVILVGNCQSRIGHNSCLHI